MSLGRHPFSRVVAAGMAAALALAACGGGADDDQGVGVEPSGSTTHSASTPTETPSTTTPSTLPPDLDQDDLTQADDVVAAADEAEIDASAFPRTVEHELGVSEIAARPERIVAMAGVADMDALLALGVVPTAAASYYPITPTERTFAPWNQEYVGEIDTFITAGDGLSLEALAALEPDLIVGQANQFEDNYDQYAGIAPTIGHAYPTDWREPIRIFGQALGLEDRALDAIAEIEAEIAAIAERVPDPAPKLALVSPFGADITVYHEGLGAGPALSLSEIGVEIVGDASPISLEQLGVLDEADWVIVFDFTIFNVQDFIDGPLFQRLPAVQADRFVVLSPEQSFSWVLETSRSIPATLDGILTEIGL
ncbi:MAG: ABC transporter substrate-binding protein [Actinomycetota bacterium]